VPEHYRYYRSINYTVGLGLIGVELIDIGMAQVHVIVSMVWQQGNKATRQQGTMSEEDFKTHTSKQILKSIIEDSG